MKSGWDLTATITIDTKRATLTAGKRGEATTYLEDVPATPLMPVSAELAQRAGLDSPYELVTTTVMATDVQNGDIVSYGGVDYPIRAIEDWPWADGKVYKVLILEELKK